MGGASMFSTLESTGRRGTYHLSRRRSGCITHSALLYTNTPVLLTSTRLSTPFLLAPGREGSGERRTIVSYWRSRRVSIQNLSLGADIVLAIRLALNQRTNLSFYN